MRNGKHVVGYKRAVAAFTTGLVSLSMLGFTSAAAASPSTFSSQDSDQARASVEGGNPDSGASMSEGDQVSVVPGPGQATDSVGKANGQSGQTDTLDIGASDPSGQEQSEVELTPAPEQLVEEQVQNRVLTPQAAAAITPMALNEKNCSYANPGTGTYAQTLCWFDFTGFTTAYTAGNQSVLGTSHTVSGSRVNIGTTWSPSYWGRVQDVDVIQNLGGGYQLRAKLSTNSSGANAARALISYAFPTWPQAFLGNTLNGKSFYTGVGGQPAVYRERNAGASAATSTVTLSDIKLYDGNNNPLHDFTLVVADAETTDNGEWITWSTTGAGFKWLPNDPTLPLNQTKAMGNACSQSYTPALTAISQNASCYANSSSAKTGTPMLATAPPTNPNTSFDVTTVLGGSGRQGVAFAVSAARGGLEVSVADRVLGTTDNSFSASMLRGTTVMLEGTTGTSNKTSGAIATPVPVSDAGTQLTYTTTATGTEIDSYTAAWYCTRTNIEGVSSRWPTTGTSPAPPAADSDFTKMKVGEYLQCNVNYTPPYITLVKEVDNGTTAATHVPANFTLKATGSPSVVSIPGASAASATKSPVAVGSYTLSEVQPSGTGAWPYGYDWHTISCVNGAGATVPTTPTQDATNPESIASATVNVAKDTSVTCTYKNVAREPRLEIKKTASPASGQTLGENTTVTYTLEFDNTKGTALIPLDHIDHLADVLDDATWVGDMTVSDGTTTQSIDFGSAVQGVTLSQINWESSTPQLGIKFTGGTGLPRSQKRIITFKVQTLPNSSDMGDRQAETAPLYGYELNNYLTERLDKANNPVQPPSSCLAGNLTCTTHPILAWKLTKMSQPLDGAAMRIGGDLHYQLRVERINKKAAGDINGIVVSDDLTQTFRYARWHPGAPVPAPALQRGIYFYKADGTPFPLAGNSNGNKNRLPDLAPAGGGLGASLADQQAANAWVPAPVFTANTTLTCPGDGIATGPHNPDCFMGTWKLQTKDFKLPDGAAYADVWFSVRIGFASDPNDHAKIVWNTADDMSGSPVSGNWQDFWQPYRQASTGEPFYNVAAVSSTDATVSVEGTAQSIEIGGPLTCSSAVMESAGTTPSFNPAGQALYPQWTYWNDGPPDNPALAPVYPTRPSGMPSTDRLPNAIQPTSPVGKVGVTSGCVVSQRVDANYFVIRKDLLFRNNDGALDRAINMVGHELELTMLVPTSTENTSPIQSEPVPIENVCRHMTSAPGADEVTYDYSISPIPMTCNSGSTPMMCTGWDDPFGGLDAVEPETCARFRPIANGAQAGRFRADRLPPAQYWLTETKAPTGMRYAPGMYQGDGVWSGTGVSPMPGAQLLADPVHFQVTPNLGRLEVFVPGTNSIENVCEIPFGGNVGDLPTACINPTGFVMVLTDVTAPKLPLAGGGGAALLTGFGVLAAAGALGGSVWWRRRQSVQTSGMEADAA